MELYGGGSSEGAPPASKSLIASSLPIRVSIRALESACRRPGVGILNRGTPSLPLPLPPRIPIPIPSPWAAFGKDAVFLDDGMAKIAGSNTVTPPELPPSLLYTPRAHPPLARSMDPRDGPDDRGGPAAENEDGSPGTCARTQGPGRLNSEEKSVMLVEAPVSTEEGIHDERVGLGGEV